MRMRRRIAATTVVLLALMLTAGCQTAPTPFPVEQPPGIEPALWPGDGSSPGLERRFCDPLPGEALPGGNFVFALGDSVRPSLAPVPGNPSERIVFAQFYETLVNMDCAGELNGGLAERWTCTEDNTVWVFTIREDARFWDGSRVNAGDVKHSWCETQSGPSSGDRVTPWSWFNARASTVTVLDARRVAVRLPEPQADFPALLTHPATAVAVRREGWSWPLGSGPCRLRASTPPPLPDLVCRPNPQHPDAPAWKELTFVVQPGVDVRDLAATGFDLARVEDLDAVRFYEEMPGYRPVALPWNRLYLLLCAPDANPSGTLRWTAPAGRLDPARELTRVAARSWPEIVLPAGTGDSCPQLAGPVTLTGSARRDWRLDELALDDDTLIYDAADGAARELAHRLAALGEANLRTVAVPTAAMNFALQWQMAGSAVIPMDLDFPTPCLQLSALLGRASWLQGAAMTGRIGRSTSLGHENLAAAENAATWPEPDPRRNLEQLGLVLPLALTHPWLILRGELAGLRLAYDGAPLLAGLGRAEPGAATP